MHNNEGGQRKTAFSAPVETETGVSSSSTFFTLTGAKPP